jgi:acetyl-CoA carboxylase biotin carboxyl carrier protein
MAKCIVESEVSGNVWKIVAAPGDRVAEGDTLMILESMKMEIPVEAPRAGTVVEICVVAEQAIDEGHVVAVLEA